MVVVCCLLCVFVVVSSSVSDPGILIYFILKLKLARLPVPKTHWFKLINFIH